MTAEVHGPYTHPALVKDWLKIKHCACPECGRCVLTRRGSVDIEERGSRWVARCFCECGETWITSTYGGGQGSR